MKTCSIILCITTFICNEVCGQLVNDQASKEDNFCIPSVIGLPRSKGVVYTHEIGTAHNIQSFGRNGLLLNGSAVINQYRKRELKVKAPLLNNDGFKIAIGLKYRIEDIFFRDEETLDNPFFSNFQDRNLKSFGSSLYALKPFRGNTFLLVRGAVNFNGDFTDPNAELFDYARWSLAPMIGFKKSEQEAYGFGVAYTQNFGRLNFYPILMYNKSFNDNWGVEMLLPKSIKVRASTDNKKNFVYGFAEFTGSAYKVDPETWISGYVRRTDLKYGVTYEREIYDFIWFGVSAGMRGNINFEYSQDPNFNESLIVDNAVNQSFFTNISIFLVPPRKFSNR